MPNLRCTQRLAEPISQHIENEKGHSPGRPSIQKEEKIKRTNLLRFPISTAVGIGSEGRHEILARISAMLIYLR